MKLLIVIGCSIIMSVIMTVITTIIDETIPRKKFIDDIPYDFRNPFSFRYRDKDFTICVKNKYHDFHMSMDEVYVNDELACITYKLERLFASYRYVDIKNKKPEKELYKIMKHAVKIYWEERFHKEETDGNFGRSYFE